VSEISRPRIRVIGGGTILLVVSVLVGWGIALAISNPGRENIFRAVYQFAAVTAVTTLLTAFLWARRLRPSESETIAALLLAELVCLGVAHFAGWFSIVWFVFVIVLNLVTVPWWVVGFWIGRATGRGATSGVVHRTHEAGPHGCLGLASTTRRGTRRSQRCGELINRGVLSAFHA
jgi:hypothetical protein